MKHNAMRFLSLLLALVMVVGLMPAAHVHAEDTVYPKVGEKVTSVEANATYIICLNGSMRALTNSQGSGAWGTHTLATAACGDIATTGMLWTLESVEGGYKIKNENGYLNISRNTASLNETGHVFELVFHGDAGWAIKSLETNEYGNNLGDSGSIGGWESDGTKFDLYAISYISADEADPFGKLRGYWTKVSVDTETVYDANEGLFEYAFDNNPNTIWHSNWQGASDKLTGENTFAGVIDFGAVYTISRFSFTPRSGNNSGQVTQASLYVKETEEAEWTLVAEHATFAADQSKKDMDFEAQAVRYVKFVAEQSSDGWVAVSEFDVAYNAPAAHEHSYEAVVTAPTCTEGGYTTYTCACGDTYIADETKALGHNDGPIVVENEKPSTCTEGGYYDAVCYCTVCGVETYRSHIEVGPDNHFPTVFPGYPATCTEPGLTDGKRCCVCLEWIEPQEEIPATGHAFGDWTETKAPTCTEDGEEKRSCESCGKTETQPIEKLGHKYEAVVTAPTCTEGGYTTYTCACGDTYIADETKALGHNDGPIVVENEKPSTCTEGGYYDAVCYCTVCGVETYRSHIEVGPDNHFPTVFPGYPATCTEPGLTDGKRCGVCLEWIEPQEEIPALGHSFGEWTETKAPTCTEDGEESHTCAVCGETETQAIEQLGHDHEAVVTDPTCTEGGYTTYTCVVCGDSYVADETEAMGHNTLVVPGYPATCTETGMSDGVICCICTEWIEPKVEIPALGHSYVSGSCVNCGEEEPIQVTVIASGWSGYTTWVLTSDGTLTFSPSGEKLENGETNLKNYWKVDGVLTLPWSPYAELITKVVISEGIHDIGQMAFYELPNLTEVQLPSTIVEIRNYAFKNCEKLTTINLENVDFIREGAFYGCSALENVSFLDGVVIEDWAFTKTPVVLP